MKHLRFTAILLALALLAGLLPTALAAPGPGWDDDCRGNPAGDGYGKHDWVLQSQTPGASCTSAGTAVYSCSHCGVQATRETAAPGHSWGGWTTTKEATCTRQGEQTRKCSRCGRTETRKTDYAAHQWGEWTVTAEATCAEAGSRERTCRVCGRTASETIARLPHTWGDWEIVEAATDHTPGLRRHVCQVCGEAEEEAFDPEGTLRRGDRGDEVRALQEGLICYGTLDKGGADGAYGKRTESAVRAVQEREGLEADGVAWPQTRAYAQHQFGEWTTVTRLSRTADGVRERVCARCGAVDREVVEALPMIRRGERGPRVEFLQHIIEDIGYRPGRIDGIYGPILDQAVAEWARDHDWYYEPGLLRPIEIDRIVGEWVDRDRPSQCGEDTPVSIHIQLTPAVDVSSIHVGQTVKYYWTAVNYGEEDCTLGPILYSFGRDNTTEDVRKQYRFVADIDGNLLKAGAENTLTGSLTFIADHDLFEWEPSGFGTLYLNAWAIGTSRETGKKWRSLTTTDRIFDANETDLVLSVELVDPLRDGYADDEDVAFRWTLTNRGAEPCTVMYVGVGTPSDQGMDVYREAVELAANGGSISDTCTVHLYGDWRYYGYRWDYFGQWWGYFEAWAKYADRKVRANDVNFILPFAQEESELRMTVEQISPRKEAYAVGDEITFRWSLANMGSKALTMAFGEIESVKDQFEFAPYDQLPFENGDLPANGEDSVTGTYTITLDEEWMYHGWLAGYDGGWRFRFNAHADVADDPEAGQVRSDDVDIFLPGRAAESDLLLTVRQISAEKERYAVGEEVVFSWMLTDLGDLDMTLDRLILDYGDADGFIGVCDDPVTLRARGGSFLAGTWSCELSEDMLRDGAWRFTFFARALDEEDAEDYETSNRVEFEFIPAQIKPSSLPADGGAISLRNNTPSLPDGAPGETTEGALRLRGLTIVQQTKADADYYDGAVIPVRMRLTVDDLDEYTLLSIDAAPGDSVSEEEWMQEPLLSGESYEFTYSMALDPHQTGWKTRTVRAWLRSKNSQLPEVEECEVRPPFTYATVTLVGGDDNIINDNAAWLYLSLDPGYTGSVYSGENLDLPINVDSDGNTVIRDVKLVCELLRNGKSYDKQTFDLADRFPCGSTMGVVKKLYAHKSSATDDAASYGLRLYLTGTYYDRKARAQTVESLPVTPDFHFLAQDKKTRIDLAYTIEPRKPFYSLNDLVTIEFKVRNSGTEPVEDVSVGLDSAYEALEDLVGERQSVNDGAALAPSGVATTVFQYRIQPPDLINGRFEAEFFAAGVGADSGAGARSLKAFVQLPVAQESLDERIRLSASVNLPRDEYLTGVGIPVRLTVENNADQPIKRLRVYATGDNRDDYLLQSNAWHDFGHGLKGPQCAFGQDIGALSWDTFDQEVLIPSALRPAGMFRPAWTVEAELEDGTMVRGKTVTLSLPIAQESLEMKVVQSDPGIEIWEPGDTAKIVVLLTYTGDHTPHEYRVVAREPGYSGSTIEVRTKEVTGNTGRATLDLPLNPDHIKDGEWKFMIQAGAIRTGTLSTEATPFTLRVDPEYFEEGEPGAPLEGEEGEPEYGGEEEPTEPGAPLEDIELIVKRLTESPNPEGWWLNGDKVKVHVTATYLGEGIPKRIRADMGDAVQTEVPIWFTDIYDAVQLSDEFEITLDSSHAVNGQCVYDFAAWAGVENAEWCDCGPVTFTLTFDMAPAAGGPDDMPDDIPFGAPAAFISPAAIEAAKSAIEAARQGGTTAASHSEKTFEPAPAKTDAAWEEYLGPWTAAWVRLDEAYVEASLVAPAGIAAVIAEDRLALTGLSDDAEAATEFADGALRCVFAGESDDAPDVTAQLLVDDTLCLAIAREGEEEMALFFTRGAIE